MANTLEIENQPPKSNHFSEKIVKPPKEKSKLKKWPKTSK